MNMAVGFSQLFSVLFVLVVHWSGTAVSVGFNVESLPGLEGPLPFQLETGYVGVGENDDSQLFYYFFKSQRNPKEDPILLWLTGGPRCSSFSAIVFGNGPIYFKDLVDKDAMGNDVPKLVLNPDSWTQVANVIFLDQPIGTGFSYSKSGQEGNISDSKSAHESYLFLAKWFIDHPEFQSNPFYISGDSYGGIIIPQMLKKLIDDIEAGNKPLFNFKGYTLGDPTTDQEYEKNERIPYAHRMGLITDELYESLKLNCKGKYVNSDSSNVLCSRDLKTYSMCTSNINVWHILEPYCPTSSLKQIVSNHNRRSLGSIRGIMMTTCRKLGYPITEVWLNNDRVRKALHAGKGMKKNWVRCNFHDVPDEVDYGVPYEKDVKSTVEYHRYLSTKGYRSLIYSGDHDMSVPIISTEKWIRTLNLSITHDWHPWFVDGQVAGYTMTYSSNMTFATLKGAAHVTAETHPKQTFLVFQRWMFHNSL